MLRRIGCTVGLAVARAVAVWQPYVNVRQRVQVGEANGDQARQRDGAKTANRKLRNSMSFMRAIHVMYW